MAISISSPLQLVRPHNTQSEDASTGASSKKVMTGRHKHSSQQRKPLSVAKSESKQIDKTLYATEQFLDWWDGKNVLNSVLGYGKSEIRQDERSNA